MLVTAIATFKTAHDWLRRSDQLLILVVSKRGRIGLPRNWKVRQLRDLITLLCSFQLTELIDLVWFVAFATVAWCMKTTSDAFLYEERVFFILEKVRTLCDERPHNLSCINILVWCLLMKITIFVYRHRKAEKASKDWISFSLYASEETLRIIIICTPQSSNQLPRGSKYKQKENIVKYAKPC